MFQKIGFMFAGQGAQAVGMGQDLAATVPAVREWYDRADAALGRSISEICFTGPQEALTKSANCQPAITATSLACLIAFQQRFPGVKPVACGGLSLGEFAALAAADVLSFTDAVKLVAARGQFFEDACRATAGSMAAVLNGDATVIEKVCAETGVDVANYNCPGQIVISGEKAKLPAAVDGLKAAGISKVIALTVDGAFHSRLMAAAVPRFAEVLGGVELRTPQCVLVQNVVGAPVAEVAQIRANLAAQITGSVRWEQCARAMIAAGAEALIEFGPGTVLSGFMKRIDKQFPMFNVGSAADLDKLAADPRFQ